MRRELGGGSAPTNRPPPDYKRRGTEIGSGRAPTAKDDRANWLPKGTLSFSALSCFNACRRKFWHRYINKTQRDPDAEFDPIRLVVGKCFHNILEDTNHAPVFDRDWHRQVGLRYRQKYQISNFELAKIVAMCIRYAEFHEKSGLIVLANEVKIHNNLIGGYIDSLMLDPKTRQWWIVDNKTSAGHRPGVKESIRRNLQLTIYAALRKHIPQEYLRHPQLVNVDNFGGCIYRCSVKPAIKFVAAKDSDFWATVARCTTESYEIRVPVSEMDVDGLFAEVTNLCNNIVRVRDKVHAAQMMRNYDSCMAYGSPCEFWSQCYGKTATECRNTADVRSVKSIESSRFDDLM